MKPMSIEWHEQCLNAMRDSYNRLENQIKTLTSTLVLSGLEIEELSNQISRAKAEGKTHFDPDKFNKKRGGK